MRTHLKVPGEEPRVLCGTTSHREINQETFIDLITCSRCQELYLGNESWYKDLLYRYGE